MFDVEYGLFDKIQNTDILITLGNTSVENKGFECTIGYNNIESRFPNHIFYIKFGGIKQKIHTMWSNP